MKSAFARKLIQSPHSYRVGTYLLGCRHSNTLSEKIIEQHRNSQLNKTRETEHVKKPSHEKVPGIMTDYRDKYPDFLPKPNWKHRDRINEILERNDMYRRRNKVSIPEFYVGSILAVSVADQFSPGKTNRFVGICIQRREHGLRHNFTLRNVIDDQGIEVLYEMYNPLLQKIEVLRLEKRLDDELFYLRDSPLEYSYFPQDMEPAMIHKNTSVPVNKVKIPLNPRPWSERWERRDLKGIQEIEYKNEKVREKLMRLKAKPQVERAWEKEDIMKHYRETINPVEAEDILTQVHDSEKKNWTNK